MREILFRAKRIDNGKWIYGYFVSEGEESYIFEQEEVNKGIDIGWYLDCCKMREVVPLTVGQYTGLMDRNGKKIFEGDILEFSDRMVSVFWHPYLGCWDIAFVKFTNIENGREDMSTCRWSYRAKVIGNIHDNPELLKRR